MRFKLIIGLGNPDEQYEKTYHNAGFLFIDYLIKNKIVPETKKLKEEKNFDYFKIGDLSVVKPTTFMNESGKAAKEAMKYFKIKPEEILVAHDDVDIETGEYKISFGRGSAGHRGVESVIKNLRTKNFWRVRVGIAKYKKPDGKPQKMRAEEYVLKTISAVDGKKMQSVFEKISAEIFR